MHFGVSQAMSLEYAPFPGGRGKLGEFEFGRGRLEAALEVVKADRWQEVKGGRGFG